MIARNNGRVHGGTNATSGNIRPEVDPGHSFDSAMALPLQPGVPLVVEDQVGGAQDPADVYSFDLAEGQPINITLDGSQGDVDLHLYDAQGNLIAHSSGEGIVVENLSGELPPGTYYVAVVPWEDAQTTYSLSIQAGTTSPTAPIIPEVDPGHSFDSAMALPLQPGVPLVVQDQVGGAQDPADVYSFELTEGQPVNITLDGPQGDVDLHLYDAQGNLIAHSSGEGIVLENLSGELPPGTYYVAVVPWEDAQTNYSLSIEAGTANGGGGVVRPEVDPGHSLDTAMALPLQPGGSVMVQDQVGGAQDPADVYSFDLGQDQSISIALQGDQGDVDLLLIDAQGNVIAESINGGLETDSIEGGLTAGSYYVAVVPYDGAETTYSLSIETGAPGAGADAAASAAMPESLALRDQTGLGNGGAASNPFGQQRDETLAGQLLAVG